ncbi:MAG: T9SS type A sorting domain-containing protein [Flavobacteriales bacterium]
MKALNTLWLLMACMPARAQVQVEEHYFADHEVAEGGKVRDHLVIDGDIVVAGSAFDTSPFAPSIVRLDTLGNVVWTTTTNDTSTYAVQMVVEKIMLGSDSFIYASCAQQVYNPLQEIWKVDPASGAIVWKVAFTTFNAVEHLLDVDSTTIAIGHASDYNSSTYATHLAFLDKSTGAMTSTHYLGERPWARRPFAMAADGAGYIYYTLVDTVYKVAVTDPDSILWQNAYAPAEVSTYGHIHLDDTSVFLFGARIGLYRARILSVDPADGSMNWWLDPGIPEVYFSDIVDRNGSLYSTWRHALTGGGSYAWYTNRVDKATGTSIWTNNPFLAYTPRAALSMDIDSAGDLYLTGYRADPDGGNWGIAKFEGATGNTLLDTVITLFPDENDGASCGVATCMIGDQPFFVGDLWTSGQGNYQLSTPYLVKLDPTTHAFVRMTAFGGGYKFPSWTVAMSATLDDRLVVLKQEGLSCVVEKYGPDSTLMWRRPLRRGYALLGDALEVDDLGRTVVAAQSRQSDDEDPFYSNETDSIHLFRLSALGSVIAESAFAVELPNVDAVQVVTDAPGNDLFVLYRKGTGLYARRFSGSTFSAETNLNVNYANTTGEGRYARERPGTAFHLIAKAGTASVKVYAINKTTLVKTVLDTLSFASYVADVAPAGGNRSLLAGSGSSKDMLVLYDHSTLDTVWMRRYDTGARLHGAVVSDDGSTAYGFGLRSSAPYGATLRSVDMADGTSNWMHLRNGAWFDNAALGAAYDAVHDVVAFTGYVSDDSIPQVRSAFLDVLDVAGVPQFGELYDGSWPAEGKGLCMAYVPNDDVWLGGYKGQPGFGEPGFLFRLINSMPLGNDAPSGTGSPDLGAFPNPFTNDLVVQWNGATTSAAQLRILGVDGRSIARPITATGSQGVHQWHIDMAGMQGCYLIELKVDGRVYVARVIGVE